MLCYLVDIPESFRLRLTCTCFVERAKIDCDGSDGFVDRLCPTCVAWKLLNENVRLV